MFEQDVFYDILSFCQIRLVPLGLHLQLKHTFNRNDDEQNTQEQTFLSFSHLQLIIMDRVSQQFSAIRSLSFATAPVLLFLENVNVFSVSCH